MKAQEAFEKALRGIIGQDGFSIDNKGHCRYVCTNGGKELRCPIGHLLDPVQTKFAWEGWRCGVVVLVDDLIRQRIPIVIEDISCPTSFVKFEEPMVRFLVDMQRAHDKAAEQLEDIFGRPSGRHIHSMMDFIERMAVVAMRWKLDVPADIIDKYDALVADTKLGRT